MLQILISMLVYMLILAVLFGAMTAIFGDSKKGNQILINCLTALILTGVIMYLFNVRERGPRIITSGIPLIESVGKSGSLKELFTNEPMQFAMDFVELVCLTIIINWISNIVTLDDSGFVGKVVSRVAIVLLSCILYGFLMDIVREQEWMKWIVQCVECLITGGSILLTPAMVLAQLTNLKEDSAVIVYTLRHLPSTSIGKAVTAAVNSDIVFILFLFAIEQQYGSVQNIMEGIYGSMELLGSCVITIIGFYVMLLAFKPKKQDEKK